MSGAQREGLLALHTQVNVIYIINCMLNFQSSNLFSPLTLFVDEDGQRQTTTMINDNGNNHNKQPTTTNIGNKK
jgi:hypothetical protein